MYARDVRGRAGGADNMEECTWEEGRARELIKEEGEWVERKVEWEVPVERTCYLGGEEERIEMEGGHQKKVKVSVPGLHSNFAWEEDIPRERIVTDSTVRELVAENERQLRDGEIAPGETILPAARPDMEIKWEGPHDAELFRGQGQGPGFGAIRDGHLQTDPLTRLMLRYDGFEESSGRLRVS